MEHLFDRTHKRVAAVKLVRFRDLVIHHEHQRDVDPAASGRCLAEAYRKGYFELPLFNHELKQFIGAREPGLRRDAGTGISAVRRSGHHGLPGAGVRRTDAGQGGASHASARGISRSIWRRNNWLAGRTRAAAHSLARWPEAQAALRRGSRCDKDGEPNPPELQVKLHECFALKEHPRICEGKLPVKLWLCAPDGKRIESTLNWPAFRTNSYPKLKPALQKKYPGHDVVVGGLRP